MTTENLEVKVVKLETKVDTILDSVDQLNRKMDVITDDRVTRRELDEFKDEITKKQFSRTLLTTILTVIVTALVSYVIADLLNK